MDLMYEIFINIVLPVVVTVVGGVVTKAVMKYDKKIKLELNQKTHEIIKEGAELAVMYVAEYSAKEIKKGNKITSDKKLDRAVTLTKKFAEKYGDGKRINTVTAEKYIESALMTVKGEGATGNRVKDDVQINYDFGLDVKEK